MCYWENSLSLFWVPWGQKASFEVAEAKFWILSSFNGFLLRIFVILSFKVIWPQRPQKGFREFFQKLHFWNQCVPTIYLSTEKLWFQLGREIAIWEFWKKSTNFWPWYKLGLCCHTIFILPCFDKFFFDYIHFQNGASQVTFRHSNSISELVFSSRMIRIDHIKLHISLFNILRWGC